MFGFLKWSLPIALAVATAFGQSAADIKELKEMQEQAAKLDSLSSKGQDLVFEFQVYGWRVGALPESFGLPEPPRILTRDKGSMRLPTSRTVQCR